MLNDKIWSPLKCEKFDSLGHVHLAQGMILSNATMNILNCEVWFSWHFDALGLVNLAGGVVLPNATINIKH